MRTFVFIAGLILLMALLGPWVLFLGVIIGLAKALHRAD